MNEILYDDLANYIDKKIFNYHTFRISEVIFQSYIDNDSFHKGVIIRQDDYSGHLLRLQYPIFYDHKVDAIKHQTLDVYRVINDIYKPKDYSTISMLDHYKKYIDMSDLDFFISGITDDQMDGTKDLQLIHEMLRDNPEYFL